MGAEVPERVWIDPEAIDDLGTRGAHEGPGCGDRAEYVSANAKRFRRTGKQEARDR